MFLKVAPDLSSAEIDAVVGVAMAHWVDALIVGNTTVSRPALRSLVKIYGTGTPPPSLKGVGAVVFMLIEPIERYPDCEAEALALRVRALESNVGL